MARALATRRGCVMDVPGLCACVPIEMKVKWNESK